MKQMVFLMIAVAGFASLTACGRVSSPAQPKDSVYPKEYVVKP